MAVIPEKLPPSYDEAIWQRDDTSLSKTNDEELPEYPTTVPPAINIAEDTVTRGDTKDREDMGNSTTTATASSLPLPVVLPQTSKAFRGAFFSPFVRAYVPELDAHGIDQDTFLTCIDALNEAFVANPVFQAAGVAGGAMGLFGGSVPPVQWAGWGLQFASGLASFATSYGRTRFFVKKVNEDLYHPAGLRMRILTTKKMMEAVGCSQSELTLPPLDFDSDLGDRRRRKNEDESLTDRNDPNDPRMRRIQALKGHVMPLDYDVPSAVSPDNLLRKMGNAQAKRMSNKQERKMEKKLDKGQRIHDRKCRRVRKAERKGEEEISKISEKIGVLQEKFQAESASQKAQQDPSEMARIKTKYDKEISRQLEEMDKEREEMERKVNKRERKADKKLGRVDKKEQKTAQKIRWVVITKWNGDDEDEEDVTTDGSEESEESSS